MVDGTMPLDGKLGLAVLASLVFRIIIMVLMVCEWIWIYALLVAGRFVGVKVCMVDRRTDQQTGFPNKGL